jgi:hypothetical protein
MTAYHQMGHDSRNLLGTVSGFAGAILSPVNETEADVISIVNEHGSDKFEFIFDPQLWFPRRVDRGRLGTWKHFPQDFDTADMGSPAWWDGTLAEVVEVAVRVGAKAVCAPATLAASTLTNDYYEMMRALADRTVALAGSKLRVLQTVPIRLADLTAPTRALEIASVISGSKASGVYLVFLSDVRPRDEFRDVDELKGAMKLIRLLEDADVRVLVGCSSSDVVLWKAAGATSCATGKFANLRRFTPGRFNEQEDGGRQVSYWFEEPLLAFLRESDLQRVQAYNMGQAGTNPFAVQVQEQIANDPGKAWVGLGWRQYMHWFADVERRLASGTVTTRDLIRTAEEKWQVLEDNDVFLEERRNDGSWLRHWLRAAVEFNR